ncbi:MAG: hypothetical protein IKK43_03355 [Clostridia bacterium]|nr:hypothetical protein [Clostridia bacterium]
MKFMNIFRNIIRKEEQIPKTLEEIRVEKIISAIADKICALVAVELAEYKLTLLAWNPLEGQKPALPRVTLSFQDFAFEGQKTYLRVGTRKLWEEIPKIKYPLMEQELLKRGWTKSKEYTYTLHYEAP